VAVGLLAGERLRRRLPARLGLGRGRQDQPNPLETRIRHVHLYVRDVPEALDLWRTESSASP
jgi:catechol-2,3-dioxygenase